MSTFLSNSDTIYKILFDFTSADQNANLKYLTDNNYQLLAFKGASGGGIIQTGVPVWFAKPFKGMFDNTDFSYQPMYKVYVLEQEEVGAEVIMQESAISDPVALGTSVTFDKYGNFIYEQGKAAADSINFINKRDDGRIIVGLAAMIEEKYRPFCAFTCTPLGSVSMTPHESCCLFAAQTNLISGSVTAQAAAPGSLFTFSNRALQYQFKIEDNTYMVAPTGTTSAQTVDSGTVLATYLNQKA